MYILEIIEVSETTPVSIHFRSNIQISYIIQSLYDAGMVPNQISVSKSLFLWTRSIFGVLFHRFRNLQLEPIQLYIYIWNLYQSQRVKYRHHSATPALLPFCGSPASSSGVSLCLAAPWGPWLYSQSSRIGRTAIKQSMEGSDRAIGQILWFAGFSLKYKHVVT